MLTGSLDEDRDHNSASFVDESLSSFVFASCPLEVWDRIFFFMNLSNIVQFTRCTSKSVFNWSCGVLTEINAYDSVCSHIVLQLPHLRAISLPFGLIRCPNENNWFDFCGNQLLTLEFGVHPETQLEALILRTPSLKRLLMGSEVTINSKSWDFLPRGMVELSLRRLRQAKTSSELALVPLLSSLFKGLPTSLRKFSLVNTGSGRDSSLPLETRPLFFSSRSAAPSFVDFLVNCTSKLTQLEHLQLPDALDLILCVEDDGSRFSMNEEKVPSTGHNWLIPKYLCHLKHLTYLSCRAVYWESDSNAKVALERNQHLKSAFSSISPLPSGATNLSDNSHQSMRDMRHWSLLDLAPKLQHLCTQQSKRKEDEHLLWSTEDETRENEEEVAAKKQRESQFKNESFQSPLTHLQSTADKLYPSSVTSLHILDEDRTYWPLDAKLAYGETDPIVWCLPTQLRYLSLPGIDSLGRTTHTHLKSLSLIHTTSVESVLAKLALSPSICAQLTHLNIQDVEVVVEHEVRRAGFSTALQESWFKSLKTTCPSLSWLTVAEYALIIPPFASSSVFSVPSDAQSESIGYDVERESRFIPSLFCYGVSVYYDAMHVHRMNADASLDVYLRWQSNYNRLVDEMRISSLNWHFTSYHKLIKQMSHIYFYLAHLNKDEGKVSAESSPQLRRFVFQFLRLHGINSSMYGIIRDFPLHWELSLDIVSLCCAFGKVKLRPKDSPTSMALFPSQQANPPTSDHWKLPWYQWSQSPLLSRFLHTMAQYNVELSECDDLKRTPLHRMIASRHVQCAACLFALKVEPHRFYIDIEQQDVYGVSARQEALQSGHHELVAMCKQRLADEALLQSLAPQSSSITLSTPSKSLTEGSITASPSSRLVSPSSPANHPSSSASLAIDSSISPSSSQLPHITSNLNNNQTLSPSPSSSQSAPMPSAMPSKTSQAAPREKSSKKRRDQAMALWDETRE